LIGTEQFLVDRELMRLSDQQLVPHRLLRRECGEQSSAGLRQRKAEPSCHVRREKVFSDRRKLRVLPQILPTIPIFTPPLLEQRAMSLRIGSRRDLNGLQARRIRLQLKRLVPAKQKIDRHGPRRFNLQQPPQQSPRRLLHDHRVQHATIGRLDGKSFIFPRNDRPVAGNAKRHPSDAEWCAGVGFHLGRFQMLR
jgi:hypothetical protein